jgi:hypothetical protein
MNNFFGAFDLLVLAAFIGALIISIMKKTGILFRLIGDKIWKKIRYKHYAKLRAIDEERKAKEEFDALFATKVEITEHLERTAPKYIPMCNTIFIYEVWKTNKK